MKITFNKPPVVGTEQKYLLEALQSSKISGDGVFGEKCHQWFENFLPCCKALLTPSCTSALELAALLIGIEPGDEIIMPSYTFVSTANAFVLRGAKIVFVDIRPDTMNIDEKLIEAAITSRTRAIVPVHYAGVGCEMDTIMAIAKRYNLYVIEDSAQGMMSSYKGKALGTIGHLGAYSFHETKNYTSGGEGGLLIVNDEKFKVKAEIMREKGTNRSQFFRGMVDKYQWVDLGSSSLLSDVQAAFLWANLEAADEINSNRLESWQAYYNALEPLQAAGSIELPSIPQGCTHNAHMFYLKVADLAERNALIDHFKASEILTVFHYVPLHTARAGLQFGRFHGNDRYTTRESERLLRLPLHFGLSRDHVNIVIEVL